MLSLFAALVTLAAVLLVLGATRSEDAALRAQGAPQRLRTGLASLQAALLVGPVSVLGALAGIGLPALSFSVYNRSARGDLPLRGSADRR